MKIPYGIKIGLVAGLCAVVAVSTPAVADPGSADDPLVSQSYIENTVKPELLEYIEKEVEKKMSLAGEHTAEKFEVVSLKNGQKLMCESGTELILRMGGASIIATAKGGIADTTGGIDLADGSSMPSNHLLIVPIGDGRGIVAQNDVLVMVKGSYTIK